MIDTSFYSAHVPAAEHKEQIFLEITEGPAAETDNFVMNGKHIFTQRFHLT